MAKLEFENRPPSKEALEESKAAARRRISDDKKTSTSKKSSSSKPDKTIVVGVGKTKKGEVRTENVGEFLTEKQRQEVSELTEKKGRLTVENLQRRQKIDKQGRPVVSRSVEFSYQEPKTPDIPQDSNFLRVAELQTGQSVDPLAVRRQEFIKETNLDVNPKAPRSTIEKPFTIFNVDTRGKIEAAKKPISSATKVRQDLFPKVFLQEETEPLTPLEAAKVQAVFSYDFGKTILSETIDFLSGKTPSSVVGSTLTSTADVLTGKTTPLKLYEESVTQYGDRSARLFRESPGQLAGEIAFDVALDLLFERVVPRVRGKLWRRQLDRDFKAKVTDPEFRLQPRYEETISLVETPEGLISGQVPRRELVKTGETFSEGYLPVTDDFGRVTELQSQLIPRRDVPVGEKGLPVLRDVPELSTRDLLQRQTELPNIVETKSPKTLNIESAPFSDSSIQSSLGSFDVTSSKKGLPSTIASSDIVKGLKVEKVPKRGDRAFSYPDPVTGLVGTATDPEFLSFVTKEFERGKTSLNRLRSDLDTASVPSSEIPSSKPSSLRPIFPSSVFNNKVSNIVETTFDSFKSVKPISDKALDISQDRASKVFQSVSNIPVVKMDEAVDTDSRSLTRKKTSQDLVTDLQQTTQKEDSFISRLRAEKPVLRTSRPRPRNDFIVPKLSFDSRRRQPPITESYRVTIGREGAKIFKMFTVGSLADALRIGKRGVTGTAAASLKIEPVGRNLKDEEKNLLKRFLGSSFRFSKVDPDVFVQKRSARISSFGEKKQITRKGLLSLKTDKGSKKAFSLLDKGFPLRKIRDLL